MNLPEYALTGKIAIVTGATKGLGRGMAEALAAAGADIVVVSRTPADCEATAAHLAALGVRTLACPTDISRIEQVEALVETTVREFGRIDILVNNAGVAIYKKAVQLTEEDWDRVLDINLKGPFLVAQAVGRQMLKQGAGKVINISSMLGLVGDYNSLPYLCSKGGLIQMTRGLALEWASHNIQVNAICPGYVETDMNSDKLSTESTRQYITGKTPLRRYGQVEEVAGLVQFLASPAADFMTGAIIPVDGGWTAQ